MPGKRARHRWRSGICIGKVRGKYWIALFEAFPEQLRPAAREERHARRLVEAELLTKPVNFDEFSGHRFEDITIGERPPVDEEKPTRGRSSNHWKDHGFWLKEPAMLMQDLLHQWWMGYMKDYREARVRPHQGSRQLAHLLGHQLSTWTVLHQLRTCENGCESNEP